MLVKEIDYFKDIFPAYPHQREWMQAFFSGKYQFYMENIHRRGGKDATFFNSAWLYASMVPGNYIYTLPKIGQAKNVIWEGTDLNGRRWIDTIPQHLLAGPPNKSERKIYFTSGSMLHITGADSILGAHLGSNLHGAFISEFQRTHPSIWDYLRPIFLRSGGFAAFCYTALGKGHAYDLFKRNVDNPNWYCRKLTVDDTRDNNGKYIFSPEQIEEERRSGMDEDLIQQEYYCDENVAVKGTFFAEQLDIAYKEGRVVENLEIIPYLPVHTSWDLGSRDTNSIWFFQVDKGMFRYFYQHDHNYGDIDYYGRLLEQVKQKYQFERYGHHFMPHDVQQTEWATGRTRNVQLMANDIRPTVVPRLKVIERVQCARHVFDKCIFDKNGCKTGLDALAVARSKWDDKARAFTADEVHDWSSHPSAAFQYGHVGWLNSYNKQSLDKQKQYARSREHYKAQPDVPKLYV